VGYPNAVLAAVVALKNGVKRAHLIDCESDGALLLEMYTRDGTPGVCMIAADLYEGIR
jgi:amino-acid N-acetyltransferase